MMDEVADSGVEIVITGSIVERQQDLTSGEYKYVILGQTQAGHLAIVVAKISPTGKLVFITAWRETS